MTEKIQGALFEKLKTAIENAEWNSKERSLTYEISKVLDEVKADFPTKYLDISYNPNAWAFQQWFKKWFGNVEKP